MTINNKTSHFKEEENMPKIITEENKEMIRKIMYRKGVLLIREKGIRKITVEDITGSTGIAKGSFYRYYTSKEEFLYEVLKKNEKENFERLLSIEISKKDFRSQILDMFKTVFLSDECLFLYTQPSDLEYLLCRLPEEKRVLEERKSKDNFVAITSFLKLDASEENYGALSYLMDGLQFMIKSSTGYGQKGKNKAVDILVNTIADFIVEEKIEK